MAVAPQHWLSMARLVVGAAVWTALTRDDGSVLAFLLVLLACLLDVSDGRLARARRSESSVGRALDNACDLGFLALFFHAASVIDLWSDPRVGLLGPRWRGVNTLPLFALGVSFGSYAVRAGVSAIRSTPVVSSPVGRAAGALNYALALVGAGVTAWGRDRPLPAVEALVVIVALVNLAAFVQNCRLLSGIGRRGG